ICPELFDVYGCNPNVIVISDDCHQYDTQKTTSYCGSKCKGISSFRSDGERRVLTTRSDGAITFSFANGNCYVIEVVGRPRIVERAGHCSALSRFALPRGLGGCLEQ